ncbi:cell envelope integrity protein CreD [Vibrio europaeus]|uniref:cell envelope integrity protein CreD n=1 Tax=Vibrio europaeus TaxID=300876 RepID=UPI00233EBA5A|nr:cell envelope integrity protein CreD [Vibrio europaeus]MDC5721747.1 cell envelope integrity protein CreD [Vibrio europaeus]MDC5758137.1 cell envelope integrity protein CreD [Vibrio europaeus]MDC5776414.1 cell envelope integrity protein CreD [Vibrio europaeus]MDC5795727.1 cell envelope integrity protein CreD [Vibrio europaeus]MDC5801670.1 cell envelope integrity protein CreD [Vibrio europaeus]
MKHILNHPLGLKFALVLLLFLLLQIPLSMVSGLISERTLRQDTVRSDIARSSSGPQRIIGPFIHITYTESRFHNETLHVTERQHVLLPDTFNLGAELDSFEKYRGIYRARLYHAQTRLTGRFDLSELDALRGHDINDIRLVVGIEDSRGLMTLGDMRVANHAIEVFPGTGISAISQGFHQPLDLAQLDTHQPLTFDLQFLLQGMGKLQVAPIGDQSRVELRSSWPHPSFIGDYLPVTAQVAESGFEAQWHSNNFSTNMAQLLRNCLTGDHQCYELEQRQMGVDLIDPVDHYLKSHRATNYSLLVITLVFASFFLLELFQARPVHPVQYGFVGLALALFYLLLISMSEHLGFNWAYGLSALASTSLLSVYATGMLQRRAHGVIFGGGLLLLYGLLFGLLQAESYALLMGTLLCFTILSFVMILTRHIDWYRRHPARPHSDVDHERS